MQGRKGAAPRSIADDTYSLIYESLAVAVPFPRKRWPRSSFDRTLLAVLSIVLSKLIWQTSS